MQYHSNNNTDSTSNDDDTTTASSGYDSNGSDSNGSESNGDSSGKNSQTAATKLKSAAVPPAAAITAAHRAATASVQELQHIQFCAQAVACDAAAGYIQRFDTTIAAAQTAHNTCRPTHTVLHSVHIECLSCMQCHCKNSKYRKQPVDQAMRALYTLADLAVCLCVCIVVAQLYV
jgi:hypothetical protein